MIAFYNQSEPMLVDEYKLADPIEDDRSDIILPTHKEIVSELPNYIAHSSKKAPKQLNYGLILATLFKDVYEIAAEKEAEQPIGAEHIPNFIITPIAQNYNPDEEKPCPKKDWDEQRQRCTNGEQMMWDDTPTNKSQIGDVLIVWHYKTGVKFHRIQEIHSSATRLASWSKNVGHTDRQVIYISEQFTEMNWDDWIEIGGWARCMGTKAVVSIAEGLRRRIAGGT